MGARCRPQTLVTQARQTLTAAGLAHLHRALQCRDVGAADRAKALGCAGAVCKQHNAHFVLQRAQRERAGGLYAAVFHLTQ